MPWSYTSIRARDIGVGANGAVWALGNQDSTLGYPVFKLENGVWVQKGEQLAVRIAVDGVGNAWVVDRNGTIYAWSGTAWSEITGLHAVDLAPAADEVWACNKHSNQIWRRHGGTWHKVGLWHGTRIAADSTKKIWHVNSYFQLFSGTSANDVVQEITPSNENGVRGVGVNGAGDVWVLGRTSASAEGYKVFKRTGAGQWQPHEAYGIALAVGPNDTVWLVTAHGAIRRYTP